MLGGVRFAHIQWNVTAVRDATTDRTVRNHQSSEQQRHSAPSHHPEAVYANNVDRLSPAERCVLSSAIRKEPGS